MKENPRHFNLSAILATISATVGKIGAEKNFSAVDKWKVPRAYKVNWIQTSYCKKRRYLNPIRILNEFTAFRIADQLGGFNFLNRREHELNL